MFLIDQRFGLVAESRDVASSSGDLIKSSLSYFVSQFSSPDGSINQEAFNPGHMWSNQLMNYNLQERNLCVQTIADVSSPAQQRVAAAQSSSSSVLLLLTCPVTIFSMLQGHSADISDPVPLRYVSAISVTSILYSVSTSFSWTLVLGVIAFIAAFLTAVVSVMLYMLNKKFDKEKIGIVASTPLAAPPPPPVIIPPDSDSRQVNQRAHSSVSDDNERLKASPGSPSLDKSAEAEQPIALCNLDYRYETLAGLVDQEARLGKKLVYDAASNGLPEPLPAQTRSCCSQKNFRQLLAFALLLFLFIVIFLVVAVFAVWYSSTSRQLQQICDLTVLNAHFSALNLMETSLLMPYLPVLALRTFFNDDLSSSSPSLEAALVSTLSAFTASAPGQNYAQGNFSAISPR